MKNVLKVCILLIALIGFSVSSVAQNKNENAKKETLVTKKVTGTYDGYDANYYRFKAPNGTILFFTFLKQSVRNSFKIDDKSLIGKNYEITYVSEVKINEDEVGNKKESEKHTVVALKPIE